MPDIIKQLPDSLANKIAAGEVVQRPSSVVKELLENSIDAGATQVTLVIKEGGKSLIQVIDNGKGMSETDARMCFERHATSKLSTTEDLFNISTYGFRGEAMASIAAVAQVELRSKTAEQELGNRIIIEGSKIKIQEPFACNEGTTLTIKNLFFNVPARRNFLKSIPVEYKHVLEEFHRAALAYPEVGFKLLNNDLEVSNLTAGKLSYRIVQLFGKNYQGQLVEVNETTDYIRVHGYIGKPEFAKKTRGEQYFIANNRFIKHHYLHHAIQESFHGLIPDKHFPFYVLNLELDPKRIDINVHPTKTEIKFDDERTAYAIIKSAVKMALGTHSVVPSIDFDQNINFGMETTGKRDYGNEKAPFEIPTHLTQSHSSSGNSSSSGSTSFSDSRRENKDNLDNWQQLFSGFDNKQETISSSINTDSDETLLYQSTINSREEEIIPSSEQEPIDNSKGLNTFKFQIHNSYIVTQVKSGMILIDQQRAHEKILYDKYLRTQENKNPSSQQFLFPLQIELNMSDYALVMELEDEIKALGFSFDDFGKNTIVINGIPSGLNSSVEQGIFEHLIEQFKVNRDQLKLDKKANLARALATRAAISKGKKLGPEEIDSLIEDLFACENPNFDPSGKPTFVILNLDTIENYFNQGL